MKPQVVVCLAWPLEPWTLSGCFHCCCHCLFPHFHCKIPHTRCQNIQGWSPHLLIHPCFSSHHHQNPGSQSPCQQSPHLPCVLTCFLQCSRLHPHFLHWNWCVSLWLWGVSRHSLDVKRVGDSDGGYGWVLSADESCEHTWNGDLPGLSPPVSCLAIFSNFLLRM